MMASLPEINERIQRIINQKKLTPSSFADAVGVSRPIISHILSGRNKPGLDLLQKVVQLFEDVDPRWLLTGEGSMKIAAPAKQPDAPKKSAPLPAAEEEEAAPYITRNANNSQALAIAAAETPEKIILLFPDGSFRMFHPGMKAK